jgi:hypothetical protein
MACRQRRIGGKRLYHQSLYLRKLLAKANGGVNDESVATWQSALRRRRKRSYRSWRKASRGENQRGSNVPGGVAAYQAVQYHRLASRAAKESLMAAHENASAALAAGSGKRTLAAKA